MVNVLKFQTLLFLFTNKMLVIRAERTYILIIKTNREDPEQTALGLHCLSMPFWQGTSF